MLGENHFWSKKGRTVPDNVDSTAGRYTTLQRLSVIGSIATLWKSVFLKNFLSFFFCGTDLNLCEVHATAFRLLSITMYT